MARGPRLWALGVDSGPRGEASEGILDPPTIINNIYFYWCPNGAYVVRPVTKPARQLEQPLTWTHGQILDFSFLGALESIPRANFR